MKQRTKVTAILIIFITLVSIVAIYPYTNSNSTELFVIDKNIKVDGKNISVNTIEQSDGTWGYYATIGDEFNVTVKNKLKEPIVLHWHGLLLPNKDDGTELTQEYIKPNSSYSYKFKLNQSGTFWMHSHYGFQEQTYVEAPLIIYPKNYNNKNDIVVMFQDFSFKKPEKIMSDLKHNDNSNDHMHHMHKGDMDMKPNMQMDLNDVEYDDFLTNYKTDDNPEIKTVIPGQTYRLRFINGSASTNFWINLGDLKGKVIAVDGVDVKPYQSNIFQLAIAQRMDIEVTIPKAGTFPILGQVEGQKKQTGIILTTDKNNKDLIVSKEASTDLGAFNYKQLEMLHPQKDSIKVDNVEKTIDLKLTGNMKDYVWKINNQTWPNVTPIELKYGKTYLFEIDNETEMSHPIHIHGHDFKVVKINGKSIDDGVIRDTLYVEPKSSITIALKANELGRWFIHCHMLYHMHSGMMTFIETKRTNV